MFRPVMEIFFISVQQIQQGVVPDGADKGGYCYCTVYVSGRNGEAGLIVTEQLTVVTATVAATQTYVFSRTCMFCMLCYLPIIRQEPTRAAKVSQMHCEGNCLVQSRC
jgi:hypothetical protein